MSQLTLAVLILLVIALWRFGPWARNRRILSYEFPIGWWNHVALVIPNYAQWSFKRKAKFEDFVRIFVDRIEFVPSQSMQAEFEIRHRVAVATQAFLLFEHSFPDPLAQVEKFFLQTSIDEHVDAIGLPRLCWLQLDLNYILLFEASSLGGSLESYELEYLPEFIKTGHLNDIEIENRIRTVLRLPIAHLN